MSAQRFGAGLFCWRLELFLYARSQQVFDVGDFFVDVVELAGEALDFSFGAAVHLVVQFAAQAVARVLPILAHHDDGSLDRSQHGEKKIQENKWIGIPRAVAQEDVDRAVGEENSDKDDDEGPRAAES